jgi:hypothetical protein
MTVKLYFIKISSIKDSVKLIKLTLTRKNNMNKLSKIVGIICISSLGMISSASADSSAFTGAYVGVSGSAIGVAIDGTHTRTIGAGTVSKGVVGAVEQSAGFEAGFSYPLSDMAFITVGAGLVPFSAEIKASSVTDGKDIKMATDDIISVFIEPSYNLTDNSAVFLKVGYSESEVAVTGTEVTNKVYDFDGTTIALGTKTIADNGLYIKTEAGFTEYSSIKVANILESDGTDFTASATADIDVAYGKLVIGYKF